MGALVAWLPQIASAFGAAGSIAGGRENAALLRQQGKVAQDQAFADEQAQRREARQVLGAQAAATAESGTGMGGSNAILLRQSQIEAELDALNTRYGGQVKRAGLYSEAFNTKRQSSMLAGGQLLSGLSESLNNRARLNGRI